ncbi:MAG TPA: ceramidase domain-containing protein [Burkholderiales bacterium]|nr:ceramidase domain-containing protein [Burkholderiales bacterium]
MRLLPLRSLILLALLGAPLAILLVAVPPIAQDPAYHQLADNRAFFSIPNFFNVASNIAFLLVGSIGLASCVRPLPQRRSRVSPAWTVFFAGTVLVAFGSAYYHWRPDDAALLWDRLPMTIAFMGLFVALLSEHIDERLDRKLLVPAIIVGIASLAWWRYAHDLRLYAWVQFAPLIAIVFLFFAYSARYTHRSYLLYGLAFYVLAKVAEHLDGQIFGWSSGIVSGHTLKHVLAAGAPLCLYLMLERRSRIVSTAAGAQVNNGPTRRRRSKI